MSPEWEEFHRKEAPIGRYAHFEKLIAAYVTEAEQMLELGVGTGGEIEFFVEQGFGYHGIDGSREAVAKLLAKYPELKDRIVCGDFTQSLYFDGKFDFIVDRASIAHNRRRDIKQCIALVWEALKPGGIFMSSDWFSTAHSETLRGAEVELGTFTGYRDGQFAGVGEVHFSSEKEIVSLFRGFDGLLLQERIVRRTAPSDLVPVVTAAHWISNAFCRTEYVSAVWDIVVRKPK